MENNYNFILKDNSILLHNFVIDEMSLLKLNKLLLENGKTKLNILLEDANKYTDNQLKQFVDVVSKFNTNIVLKKQNEEKREDDVAYIYSKQQFEKIDRVNLYYKQKTNKELLYQEFTNDSVVKIGENCWKHSQVKRANNKIEDIANDIKSKNLTPYEAMIYIHEFATSFTYKTEQENESAEKSRNVVEIFDSFNPNIVCVGYASLVKAVVDKLNLKGLSCEINYCSLPNYTTIDDVNRHANNIIKIYDPIYNIDGTFIEDACWDSVNKKINQDKTFTFFMYPFKDTNNFYNKKFIFEEDGKYLKNYNQNLDYFEMEEFMDKVNLDHDNFKSKLLSYITTLKLKQNNVKSEDIINKIDKFLNNMINKKSVFNSTNDDYRNKLYNIRNYLVSNDEICDYNELQLEYKIKETLKDMANYNNLANENLIKTVKGYAKIDTDSNSVVSKFDNTNSVISFNVFKQAYINYKQKTGQSFKEEDFNNLVKSTLERTIQTFNVNAVNMFSKKGLDVFKDDILSYADMGYYLLSGLDESLKQEVKIRGLKEKFASKRKIDSLSTNNFNDYEY